MTFTPQITLKNPQMPHVPLGSPPNLPPLRARAQSWAQPRTWQGDPVHSCGSISAPWRSLSEENRRNHRVQTVAQCVRFQCVFLCVHDVMEVGWILKQFERR